MKLLILSEFFPKGEDVSFSGGVEARNFFVAKYLAKNNDVTILTSRLKKTKAREKMFGFRVVRVGKVRNYTPVSGSIFKRTSFMLEAIKAGKNIDCEIVEGSNFLTHFIARMIGSSKKIPVVFWYPDVWLGSWVKNAGLIGIFGGVLERINLFLSANAYIVISRQTENKLNRYKSKNIKVISCGVDKNEFRSNTKKLKTPTIITVSRLTKYKNIKTLILAFAYLSTKLKNVNLVVVGSGPQRKYLEKMISELKISKKVRFYSDLPREKLINLYKSSSIFSLPSKVEGFGIATVEAAAAGLPYVNSDIEIQKEVTRNGKGGFLVNPDAPMEFTEKLNRLLMDKNIYLKKQKEAIELSRLYDWKKIAQETEKVFRSLL